MGVIKWKECRACKKLYSVEKYNKCYRCNPVENKSKNKPKSKLKNKPKKDKIIKEEQASTAAKMNKIEEIEEKPPLYNSWYDSWLKQKDLPEPTNIIYYLDFFDFTKVGQTNKSLVERFPPSKYEYNILDVEVLDTALVCLIEKITIEFFSANKYEPDLLKENGSTECFQGVKLDDYLEVKSFVKEKYYHLKHREKTVYNEIIKKEGHRFKTYQQAWRSAIVRGIYDDDELKFPFHCRMSRLTNIMMSRWQDASEGLIEWEVDTEKFNDRQLSLF